MSEPQVRFDALADGEQGPPVAVLARLLAEIFSQGAHTLAAFADGLSAPSTPAGAPAQRQRFPNAAVRELFAATLGAEGEALATSYLDPSPWDADTRTITPWSDTARRWFGREYGLLSALAEIGVTVDLAKRPTDEIGREVE
jgi:hypothetical protein